MSDSSTTVEKKIALIRFSRDAVNWKCIFQCDCCKLENDDDIPRTLPDLSIIYKLHLESRKLINMYDWLQVTIPARAHVYRLIPVTLTVTNPADRLVILIATAAASDSRKHVIVSKAHTRGCRVLYRRPVVSR